MSVIGALEEVLDEEQRILMSGDFAKLERLAAIKTELAEQLAATSLDVPAEAYSALVERAAHNEQLLSSARRGIQAAIAQLKQFADGEHQSTYSKEGQRRPLARRVSVTQKF